MTSNALKDMIATRYPAPEWALAFEVANESGGGRRYADAIAFNLWRSRGHQIHGFEIKVDRRDWLRELKNPGKAEAIARYCDRWYVVALPDVVKLDELPEGWGLLVAKGGRLWTEKDAPAQIPTPLDRVFAACLIRRAFESVDVRAQALVREQQRDLERRHATEVQEAVTRATREAEQIKKNAAEFEQQTGLSIKGYVGPTIDAVNLAKKIGAADPGYTLNMMRNASQKLSAAIAALEEMKTAT